MQAPNKDVQTKLLEEIEKLSRKVDRLSTSEKTQQAFPKTTASVESVMSQSYQKMA